MDSLYWLKLQLKKIGDIDTLDLNICVSFSEDYVLHLLLTRL